MTLDDPDLVPLEQAERARARPEDVPLVVLTAAELLALPLRPRGMVLDPVIPEQGLAMLYSKRGVGKTFTALAAAHAVASGGAFLRWTAPLPRPVLYVDGEMPAATMRERLDAIMKGATGPAMPDLSFLRIISPEMQAMGLPDLSGRAGQAKIEAVLGDAALLVLDNLSTLCRGGKENEAESWLPIQHLALSLRRRGVSVLFVHHAGKGGGQRGTSRREDVLDTVIALRHPADYNATEGARFEVHLDKARGLSGAAARPFEARIENRDGAALWSVRDLEDAAQANAAALFAAGLSIREVAEELGISKSKAHRIKQGMGAA